MRGEGAPGIALILVALGIGCGGSATGTGVFPPAHGVIPDENQRAGDPGWRLAQPGDAKQIAGYGSRMSVAPGDTIDVAVSVAHAEDVHWSAYRIGWYGGAGARLILDGSAHAAPQPDCPRDATTARVECAWPAAFQLTVPSDALAGVYLIKLHGDDGYESYVPFVVHDGRRAQVVLDVNVTSWQAYNDFGGESLYSDASGTMPHGKAWEVSFDRPFANDHGAGRFLDWEVHFVHWIEALGYDVTYTTALDLTRDPSAQAQVGAARVFVSVANDEYWTVDQRHVVEAARDGGTALAFLGADQGLWRIRLQPSTAGTPDRVIACYKADQDRDPVLAAEGPGASTAEFRDAPNADPENALVGVMYTGWMLVPQPLAIVDGASWILDGTGLGAGDVLPMMTSVEVDTRFANGVEPGGLSVVAESPVVDGDGRPVRSDFTWYTAPSGAEVVAVGSLGWAAGLGDTPLADARVAHATRNVLDRLVRDGRHGGPDPDGAPWTRPAAGASLDGDWAARVDTIAGSPSASTFVAPAGIAVAPDGTAFVADAPAHRIWRIGADATHSISPYAGDGTDGLIDGPGAAARFRWPTGLALAADGTLLVADSDNHVIRAIAADAAHTVSTYAGVASRSGGPAVDGPGASARFNRPVALALAPDGALYVADMHDHSIRRVAPGGNHAVSTVAGGSAGFGDGPGSQAAFDNPSAIAVGSDGSLYVIDTYNHALRRIAPDGTHTVTTLVGPSDWPALVDGPGSEARLGAQAGLTWIGDRLILSDVASARLREVIPGASLADTRVRTVAGSGHVALSDGAGSEAAFAAPLGLASAPDGSVWIADSGNRAVRRVQLR